VTAEMGILGALAAAFLIGTIFWDLLVKLKRNPPRNRFLLLALFGGVVAFLTHCLVSFPLRLPASSLNFVLFLGLLQGGFFGKPKNIKLSQRRIWAVVASIFLLTVPVTVLAYQDFLADVYLDAGITNLKKGRYSLARTELERSIKLDFQPTQSLFYLGIVYKNLGEREKSIKTLERSLKHFIVEPTYLHLGELYIATGDYGKAEERLKELLSMHPSPLLKLSARYLLAVVDIKRGDIQEGMARLEDIVKEHKDYERAYVIMGQVYLDQGDLKGAAKSFQKALDIVGEKLERINRRLVKLKEIGEATLDEYFQLRGEKERLEGMEKELKKILAGL
jgi:tetratricopeptide (TPR) repeat protein